MPRSGSQSVPVAPEARRVPAAGFRDVKEHVNDADSAPAERGTCLHCELPLPAGRPFGDFCCSGCRAVNAILDAQGLRRFYELGGAAGRPIGAVPGGGDLDWIEDVEARGEPLADGASRCSVDVQGIHCAACVWLLQALWSRTPGALRLDLNPSLGRADLVYERGSGSLAHWAAEAGRLGYRLGPPGKVEASAERGLLLRAGICAALALNAMMFAFSGHLGLERGALRELFDGLAFGLATLAMLIGGPVFFRAALHGLRRRVLHLDLPISLGILLAWGASTFGYWSGLAAPYFDTVTIFVALMLLGRYAQRAALRRNRDYLLAHDGVEHVRARRVRGGRVERVGVRALQVGDELRLVPGDLVPADVVLQDGAGAFSLDWINGESRPREFAAGAEVPAGAFVAARQPLRATVVRDVEASGLLRLLAAPATPVAGDDGDDQDLRGRGRFWRLVNRTYVSAVLLLATLAGLGWALLADDPLRAVSVTTAVLVVTCPCALGLATPLAFDLAVAGLRRAGVFVRGAALLEKARHVRKVVFDKTGTLTWGGVEVRPLREPPAEVVDVLYTLAASSNHPVSVAVAARLEAGGRPRLVAGLHVEEVVGAGLRARSDGVEYRLGSQSFTLGDRRSGQDHGLCVFTRDGHPQAVFEVAEDFRSGAGDEVAALRGAGLEVWLLSGDRPDRVERAARELGFPAACARGGLIPEAKAELVDALDAGDTLMVGDGLNDAPAFASAYCAGTPALDRPVLPGRADFFYTGVGTGAVRGVLQTASDFHRVVTRNLWLAGAYNIVAVGLAAAGMMTPLLCAVLMPISSLVLVGHTAWALRAPRRVATRPDATRPDAARPDAARPDAAQPDAARPAAATGGAA